MIEYTDNFNLIKPGQDEFYNVEIFNNNADIIDAELKNLKNTIENLNADGITLPDGKTISEKFTEITKEIGNTEELDTETKLSLVSAINEINQALVAHKADIVSQEVGKGADMIGLPDPNNLFTSTNVGGAMQELFTNVSNGKDLISRAITDIDDSIVIPTNPTFSDLANIISGITTGLKSANGTTYLDSNGNLVVSGLDFKPYISFGAADPWATFAYVNKEPFDIPQDIYANRNSNHVQGGFTVYNALKGTNDEPYKWWAFGE